MEGGLSVLFELNARDELCQDDQVQDDGRSQQRVLTGVVQHNGVLAAQEDLAGVLVQCTLAVTHVGHIPASTATEREREQDGQQAAASASAAESVQ